VISSSARGWANAERGCVSPNTPKAAERRADEPSAPRMKFFMRMRFIFISIAYFDGNCNSLTGNYPVFFVLL
jgi:hypothetical protein